MNMEKGIENAFLLCNGNEKQIEVGVFLISNFDKRVSDAFVNSIKTYFSVYRNEVPIYKTSLVKKSSFGFNFDFNLN